METWIRLCIEVLNELCQWMAILWIAAALRPLPSQKSPWPGELDEKLKKHLKKGEVLLRNLKKT